MDILLIQCNGHDLSVLTHEFELAEYFFIGNGGSDANNVSGILLNNFEFTHCLSLIMRTELSRICLARFLVSRDLRQSLLGQQPSGKKLVS